MAPRGRRAALDTIDGIAEDLLFAREALGIDRADNKRLAATVRQIRVDSADGNDADAVRLEAARSLLKRHVAEICQVHQVKQAVDPCEVAAASSLWDLLVPDDIAQADKALVVRKRHLEASHCHMTADGLRKREDRIIPIIAESAFDEIYESDVPRYSLKAILDPIALSARALGETIRELLRTVYGVEDFSDDENAMWLAQQVHMGIAHMHAGCQAILMCLAEPRERSRGDLWFAFCAYNILTLPFDRLADRRVLAEVYKPTKNASDIETFLATLGQHPAGHNIVVRWEETLKGCSRDCEFERSNDRTRMCRLHQLVLALDELADSYQEAQERTLEGSLRERFGKITDYLE